MSYREDARVLQELNFPQNVHYVHGGLSKEHTSGLYMPPVLRDATNSRGQIVAQPTYGAPSYGAEPLVDASTLANIEMLAPPVAQLIANKTPEESVAILRGKVAQLQPYKNLPLVGKIAKGKIQEYRLRIKALNKQVEAEEYKRKALYVAYTFGAVATVALSAALGAKVIQYVKNR